MADNDVLTRLDKQMEGNSLALSAVAEVLQKMEGRMLHEEEMISKQREDEYEATEREALIKAIAGEVVSVIKQGGMDVDGKKTRAASKSVYSGDNEKPVSPTSKIEDQQATIQAMFKTDDEDKKKDEDDYPKAEKAHDGEDDDSAKNPVKSFRNADDPDDEDEDDNPQKGYAMKGDADDDDDDDGDNQKGYNKAMSKELDALRKQIAAYETGMQKAVQSETETRLRKMGFREETSLQRPLRIEGTAPNGLGVDGTTTIKKGGQTTEDTVEQLMQLSYKDLRTLQTRMEMGDTEGIPVELLNR